MCPLGLKFSVVIKFLGINWPPFNKPAFQFRLNPDSGTADSGIADSGTANSGTADSGTDDSGTSCMAASFAKKMKELQKKKKKTRNELDNFFEPPIGFLWNFFSLWALQ